ncbi:hypothetical protein ACG04Q_17055 [Roseateles sp. DXS20W]|uniref:Uncharacterized protein n=1 Tax=Pelomonas lactea TaxID=3299030 RepID=A0ABW7GN86_9BURK
MPYTLTFSKQVEIADTDLYINDCCIGGDVVLDRLLPALREKYGNDLRPNQEDWGWFVWFDDGPIKLAVDVSADDDRSKFQMQLTSRRPRFILSDKVEDGAELEALRELIVRRLTDWPVSKLTVEWVNEPR